MTSVWRAWDDHAWTDDWIDLCDALGVDWRSLPDSEVNSRQLRKLVTAHATEHGQGAVDRAIVKLRASVST